MSDFKKAAKNAKELEKRLEVETERGLDSGMSDVAASLRRRLRTTGPRSSGHLARSIFSASSPSISDNSYAKNKIMGANYWRYLEFGTGIYSSRGIKAASPNAPLKPIYRWVINEGITPRPESPYEDQYELAQAIAHSLSSGNEQHKFVRPVWRGIRGREHVVNSVGDGMNRALRKSF